jgi:hypothetical protein
MMAKANQLEELSDQQRQAVLLGAEALKVLGDFARRSFDQWMIVAKGIAPLCELAARPGMSRKARKNLLKDNGYGSLSDATVSRLWLMAKHETAIRIWRDGLKSERKRHSWNSPTSICNRCPALRKAMAEAAASKPPRKKHTGDKTLAVDRVIERLVDLLDDMDTDNRRAVIERITGPFRQELGADERRPIAMIEDDSICRIIAKWAEGKSEKTRGIKAYRLVRSLIGQNRNDLAEFIKKSEFGGAFCDEQWNLYDGERAGYIEFKAQAEQTKKPTKKRAERDHAAKG